MYIIDDPELIVSKQKEESISTYKIKPPEMSVFILHKNLISNLVIIMNYIINNDAKN